MDPTDPPRAPRFLTTREVAEMLRVKERKVYDLAAAGEIPHRRITGKLLFPADDIARWIGGDPGSAPTERPAVLAGSHDPLLDWAIRESGSGLATLLGGSLDGLDRFCRGEAALAGLHVPEDEGWNIATVAAMAPASSVLVTWAARKQGLLLGPSVSESITGIPGIAGLRVLMRQPGAGGRALFDRLLADAGLAPDAITPAPSPARTETDVAAGIAAGEADAALGLEAMAHQFRLRFVPLAVERFDLLIDRRAYFTPPVQRLIAFTRTEAFAAKAASFGGYVLAEAGTVQWLSP